MIIVIVEGREAKTPSVPSTFVHFISWPLKRLRLSQEDPLLNTS